MTLVFAQKYNQTKNNREIQPGIFLLVVKKPLTFPILTAILNMKQLLSE